MKNITVKQIFLATALLWAIGAVASFAASPTHVIEILPASNEVNPVVVGSTASVSAVTASSTSATRVDTTFNAAALSALGATYQRAEITVQNKDTEPVECGYSPGLTIGSGFEIAVGAAWTFSLGKNVALYCIAASG
jgi:hypothetical protein